MTTNHLPAPGDLDAPSTARDIAERYEALADDILAEYAITPTDRNRGLVVTLLRKNGPAGTRTILTRVHGTPAEIAAGNRKRDIISSSPAVNGRIALGMIR